MNDRTEDRIDGFEFIYTPSFCIWQDRDGKMSAKFDWFDSYQDVDEYGPEDTPVMTHEEAMALIDKSTLVSDIFAGMLDELLPGLFNLALKRAALQPFIERALESMDSDSPVEPAREASTATLTLVDPVTEEEIGSAELNLHPDSSGWTAPVEDISSSDLNLYDALTLEMISKATPDQIEAGSHSGGTFLVERATGTVVALGSWVAKHPRSTRAVVVR